MPKSRRSFVVSSFGKTYHVTGWKVGYVTAPAALMNEFRKVHQFNVFTVNTPVQYGLSQYMTDPAPYLNLPAFYQAKRDFFRAGLANTRFRLLPSDGTYFQCVDYSAISDMSEADVLSYWMGPDKETFVAEENGVVLGTYYIRPNYGGGGRHVCNCAYMVEATAVGRGIAQRMCEHSMDHARAKGYQAMQFNFVVSTNERAVKTWLSYGFEIVGRLPGAFNHPRLGYVDAFVMYRQL